MGVEKRDSILIFYGYSGDEPARGRVPQMPNGQDHNKSFQLCAETLRRTLQRWFPQSDVLVHQAWTKGRVFEELEKAAKPIRQVHLFVHGTATWLSLAYHHNHGLRLRDRVRRFNRLTRLSKNQRAMMAWAEEDAIIAGYFTHAMNKKRLAGIKGKHTEDAAWQIWGCFAGYETDEFGHDDPELDAYFKRFGLGNLIVRGIASEIAKVFSVHCTAAKGEGGLEFWHRDKQSRKVLLNSDKKPYTAAVTPFWLWLTARSSWVTFARDGKMMKEVLMFQKTRVSKDLTKPQPPKWLTDGYR